MAGRIRTDKDGAIGFLIDDHPERRNALTSEMWRQIPPAIDSLAADDAVRVIVMRGEGTQAFVSGADISQFTEARSGQNAAQYERENLEAFVALSRVPKPLVTAIHGFCIGGGVALSVCSDLRYAADDAVFAVPAGRLGLGYPPAGAEALIRLLGFARAKELFFTARRLSAAEALGMGLVNQVFPKAELDARVHEIALGIADNAPLTLRAFKRTAIELEKPERQRDERAVQDAIDACFGSQDYAEGIAAFLGKRKPVFQGR
jgi:enoyl-CoA hydratase